MVTEATLVTTPPRILGSSTCPPAAFCSAGNLRDVGHPLPLLAVGSVGGQVNEPKGSTTLLLPATPCRRLDIRGRCPAGKGSVTL